MVDHRRAHILIGGVAGSVDNIDGADLAAGDTIQCINSDGIYHYVNIQDSATENSPYVIRPDTNPGTNSWHLVVPQGPMSHVEAARATSQDMVASTETTVIFTTEVSDILSEYNNATGVFTAIYAGKYLINSMVVVGSRAWGSGEYVRIHLLKNGTVVRKGSVIRPASFTGYVHAFISTTILLAAADTIEVAVYQNSDADTGLLAKVTADNNWLTIDRII